MQRRPSRDGAAANFDTLSDQAFVRLPVVMELFATSGSTVWRWVKQGIIPQPKKLGPQTTVWNVGELRAALEKACLE